MNERRGTITLSWRPKGTPARRMDDFAQMPYHAPITSRRTDIVHPDMAEIHDRLQNWSRWVNGQERHIGRSATAAFCDRLRKEAGLYISHSDERRQHNDEDALLIERSLLQLRDSQKALLRMHYAQGRQWQPICRVLKFPINRDLFEALMVNAQTAIETAVMVTQKRDR